MKVGLQINQFKYDTNMIGSTVADIARRADEAGFASIWVMDHFFQIRYLGPETDPMLEAYTTLGYLAAVTKKATLGTLVTGVVYRDAALLVKVITTLDVLSGGRAVLGIGAGWNEDEAVALGLGRPLAGGRFEKLEETIQIAEQMWSGNTKPFHGKHWQLEHPISSPMPLAKPRPRILIGGGGEQKTLKLVAQYADACNLFAMSDDLPHKLDILRRHCKDVGRNYDEIEKTALMGMDVAAAASKVETVKAQAEELSKLGIEHIIFANGEQPSLDAYETFGLKIVPALAKL